MLASVSLDPVGTHLVRVLPLRMKKQFVVIHTLPTSLIISYAAEEIEEMRQVQSPAIVDSRTKSWSEGKAKLAATLHLIPASKH
jgi:hypothetical protein